MLDLRTEHGIKYMQGQSEKYKWNTTKLSNLTKLYIKKTKNKHTQILLLINTTTHDTTRI